MRELKSQRFDDSASTNSPSSKPCIGLEGPVFVQEGTDVMLDLYKQLLTDIGLHWRDIQCITKRATNEGISFFTQTLPVLGKAVDKAFSQGYFKLPTNFKKSGRKSALPGFLGSLFRQIFADDGRLLPCVSAIAVQQLRQVCYFAYKMKLPYSPSKEQAVLDRFVDTEIELAQMDFDPSDPILKVANLVVNQLFDDFDPDSIVAKHGPGITSNVALTDKNEAPLSPLPSVSYFPTHFFFNAEDGMTRLDRYPTWTTTDYFCGRIGAKVLLVPKDSRGPRLISCEPVENQYIQQGIFKYMVERLEQSPVTGGQVNFTDQTINRELAREGSLTQKWATLDLKDASDRIHNGLVKVLFANTKLNESLQITRSTFTVLPDGRKVKLNKFAPMGSACCFPVLATCVYTLLLSSFIGYGVPPHVAPKIIFVYGDDIIVPSELASYAISVLERYGLKVNVDKSFIASRFAESCGFDGFEGNDVSPIRLKELPPKCSAGSSGVTPKARAVSILETANHLSKMAYARTSSYLYSCAKSLLGSVPYGYPHSPYLNRNLLMFQPDAVTMNRPLPCKKRRRFGELREVWRFHRVVPSDTRGDETPYGHMMRTFPQLGMGTSVSAFGVFQRPRDYVLKYQDVDHVAMSAYPAARF